MEHSIPLPPLLKVKYRAALQSFKSAASPAACSGTRARSSSASLVTAVTIEVRIPSAIETAKPRTGPEPKKYKMAAATNMVTLESTIVAKARLKPASSAATIERPRCASSRMRS